MADPLVTFAGFRCRLRLTHYQPGGRTAIQLVDAIDSLPVATASVNLPAQPLAADEVAIKSWSENEGLLDVLPRAGIVALPHRFVATSHMARVPICRLLLPQSDFPY